MTGRRDPAAGVTLIEMVVALAIFALIGGAGFGMLDQVLRTDARTSGRLERLGDLQRAVFVIGQDFALADPRSVRTDGGGVMFGRDGAGLRYHLNGTDLRRDVAGAAGSGRTEQVLVTGVQAMRWRFLADRRGWMPDPATVAGSGRPRNPLAVEVVLTLTGGQTVRRVALLPREAD